MSVIYINLFMDFIEMSYLKEVEFYHYNKFYCASINLN
jgi:hypothetical protein